ncbi:MAG: ABC transporter permease subunit [Bdellovibrionaceae bacterium]|nr:ABC transporter permease subunit [Pseudobdellovibrionaceae bacterium]
MGIWVIYKKEVKTFFTSPWFCFVFFLVTFLLSILYLMSLENFAQMSLMPGQGQPPLNIHTFVFMPHLNWLYLTFLVLIPLLTMRTLSEEKKERTMDLLLTSPLTSLDIVLGKFFACWTAVLSIVGVTFLFPLATSLVADFDWGPLWGSYLGMVLLTAFNVSLCLIASALTESALLSGFLGFLFILSTMVVGSGVGKFSNPILSAIFEQMALVLHLEDFFQGTLDISAFVYLISAVVFFCFITQRVVESARWR